MVKQYKPKKAMLPCSKGNKKVPAGVYALNIPLIKIKSKNNYIPQIHLSLNNLRSSPD